MSRRVSRQFLFFCVAGVIGLGVDTAVLYALAPWLGWYGARVVSFLSAATATWWLNRRFAFASPSPLTEPWWRQYLKYLLSMTVGGLVNYAVYVATLQWVPIDGAALLGVALGSIGGLGFNFVSARYLVFRQRQAPHNASS
ncbi:GtrA family protein [Curvibacter sp. HBC61]|uniref:GtrA family protein n=1 Tax=Curvibacter cyanobacteriorum TaxID=3026422 RepID=A0ABT5N3V5_9BURK|nr:GtrA family protein [Curvibacter sp. HBC61]MDD0840987.1 GtrA family protein [Curvibacter sp. HBC61]